MCSWFFFFEMGENQRWADWNKPKEEVKINQLGAGSVSKGGFRFRVCLVI